MIKSPTKGIQVNVHCWLALQLAKRPHVVFSALPAKEKAGNARGYYPREMQWEEGEEC